MHDVYLWGHAVRSAVGKIRGTLSSLRHPDGVASDMFKAILACVSNLNPSTSDEVY